MRVTITVGNEDIPRSADCDIGRMVKRLPKSWMVRLADRLNVLEVRGKLMHAVSIGVDDEDVPPLTNKNPVTMRDDVTCKFTYWVAVWAKHLDNGCPPV